MGDKPKRSDQLVRSGSYPTAHISLVVDQRCFHAVDGVTARKVQMFGPDCLVREIVSFLNQTKYTEKPAPQAGQGLQCMQKPSTPSGFPA